MGLKGGWKLVDLVNDYYVVKFELEEDLNFVLTRGPWIITGQYLALKRIGDLLGKLLKIDSLTTAQNMGKFAHLCVELDLTKPIKAFVQVNQTWYNIEYESLLDICYLCGMYGHKRDSCEMKAPGYADSVGEGHVPNEGVGTSSDVAMEKDGVDGLMGGLRGPWMNVSARRKPKVVAANKGSKGSGNRNRGSMFDALRKVGENFGLDKGLVSGNGAQTGTGKVDSSTRGADMGQKIWTKSKTNKAGFRAALSNISNSSLKENIPLNMTGQRLGDSTRGSDGTLSSKGKMIVGGKRVEKQIYVQEQLNTWVRGNNEYTAKDVYIIGHQPLSIDACGNKHAEECDTDTDIDTTSLVSSAHDGGLPQGHMDMSVGQKIFSQEKTTSHAFNNVEGITIGS
ncbi:unnamed protein product [Prunus armeniaca]